MWLELLTFKSKLTPLNAELNPICHLLLLLGAHHILHVSRVRVNVSSCDWMLWHALWGL